MAQSNGNCKCGLKTSEQTGLTDDCLGNMHLSARRLRAERKKCLLKVLPALLISNVATVLLCVLPTRSSCPTGTMTRSSCPTTILLSCSSEWVGYGGKCYYFSESEATWNSSQRNCSASGASLVVIEDQKEMNFIMQHKRATDYWIGLKRKEGQPWEWANGSIFNNWFEIRGVGFCAYLNDDTASSTWCSTQRNWICSKSI